MSENFGDEKYEEILNECSLKTKEPFIGPGTYPDEDLMAITNKAVEKLGITLPEALRAFGKFSFLQMGKKFPDFLKPYDHPKPFLKTIESVIHVEVKKLYQDADPPRFIYKEPAANRLTIKYESKRRLCQYMEGLIDGVADFYKSPIQYKQKTCMLEGGGECEFDLTFSSEGTSVS